MFIYNKCNVLSEINLNSGQATGHEPQNTNAAELQKESKELLVSCHKRTIHRKINVFNSYLI